MSIKVLGNIPNTVYVACSGGVDSMVVVDFLLKGRKDVIPLFFNHGTKTSSLAKQFLISKFDTLVIGNINTEKPKGKSQEEFWREERYKFFSLFTDRKIITCHHLDDQVENWIFGASRGRPRLIPYSNGNILRPFITTTKDSFYTWAADKNVAYLEDESNKDNRYSRNRIRNLVLPELYKVSPGLRTTVKKKVELMYKGEIDNDDFPM